MIRQIVSTLRQGRYIGDVALLKQALFAKSEGPSQHRDKVLTLLDRNQIELTLSDLESLPEGTLGKECFNFMQRYRLNALNFSPEIAPLFSRFPVSSRYARLHDLIHVILGFEADLAGELGVYAFIHQQFYTVALNRAYLAARIFTRVFRPWSWKTLRQSEMRGIAMAQDAKILVAEPLEDHLAEPLAVLRAKLLPHF